MPKVFFPSNAFKIALPFLAAVLLLFGHPIHSKPPAKNSGPNILRFDVPYSLGPFVINPTIQAGVTNVMPFVFSYLAVPDQNGRLQPDLAESWFYNDQTCEWTFYLRKDARFHDGKPVTASDVAFSLKTSMAFLMPELLACIQFMEPVSDTKLRIRFSRNDPEFLDKIWDLEIFQAPNPDAPPEEFLIGSGPFLLKEKNTQQIVLKANKAYYRGRPSLDGMVFTFVPDQEQTWTRLMGGRTDAAMEITPENVPATEACADRFYINHHLLPFYTMLLFNAHDPLFSDVRVRKALTMAIHREDFVQKILNGNGTVATGPMGLDPQYHNPKLDPVPYDPQNALELLALAGWKPEAEGGFLIRDGKLFEFTVCLAEESSSHQRLAQYLRLCFNDIGIRLHARQMPMDALIRSYFGNREFQAVITECRDPHRTFDHLKIFWSGTKTGGSMSGVEDAVLAGLFETLEAKTDPESRKDLFYAIEARILDLQPAAFLYHETVCDVLSRRFDLPGPFYLSPDRGWNLQFAFLKK